MKIAALLCTLFATALPVYSWAGESAQVHEDVIHDSLSAEFTPANLGVIESGCAVVNKTGGDAELDSRVHFTDDNMSKCVAAMDRRKKLVMDFANDADSNGNDRARMLYNFGMILHSAADFYFHTNYIEILVDQAKDKGGVADPYSLPLVDWTHLPVGKTNGVQWEPTYSKDEPTSATGKEKLNDTTYFKVAKELAVRESTRQWTLLQALLKLKYPTRADLIITALKQASCPKNVKLDEPD